MVIFWFHFQEIYDVTANLQCLTTISRSSSKCTSASFSWKKKHNVHYFIQVSYDSILIIGVSLERVKKYR